ncbi:MAG: CHASE domain-containing protein [Kouleothrix sp.]|nr:CHASE domain-containing protein [Kouleothrix sp.]
MNDLRTASARPQLFWAPYVALLTSLLISFGAAYYVGETSNRTYQLRFENQVQQTQDAIAARIETYISTLRGVSGLFAAEDMVERPAFHAYVSRLDLPSHYPGIQGIGFSLRAPPDQRAAVVDFMRRQGVTDFRIWPDSDRPEYHTIIYLEPEDRRNLAAIGFDMFQEPVRRAAMERARDTGLPAASGKVVLVQEIDDNKQAGFLIYVPAYRGGAIPATVAQRRADLLGFAYSPFRAGDLLNGIFGSQTEPRIGFELYDGAEPAPERLLHRSERAGDDPTYQPSFTTTTTLTVAGRTWSLVYATRPAFERTNPRNPGVLIVTAGLLIGVLLFVVMRSLTRARAEAEAAVRVRDAFLSVASHELKTPLTSLFGNAQLLLRRAGREGGLSERDRRSARVIAEQSQRLNKLIDMLLDHSRIQAGRFRVDRAPLNLSLLVRQVVDEIRPTLAGHVLELSDAAEPLIVAGDELRLEQALQNLIGNAVKYSPLGGPIAIEVERQHDDAIVRIADRGIGIPRAALAHLFEQFYRAPNVDARSISGMGIGLYVTHEIVAQHGGTIAVDSVEGQGSIFTMRLPLAAPPPSPIPDQSAAPEPDKVTR